MHKITSSEPGSGNILPSELSGTFSEGEHYNRYCNWIKTGEVEVLEN